MKYIILLLALTACSHISNAADARKLTQDKMLEDSKAMLEQDLLKIKEAAESGRTSEAFQHASTEVCDYLNAELRKRNFEVNYMINLPYKGQCALVVSW